MPEEGLRFLHRGPDLNHEGGVGHPAGVEVDLAFRSPLRDPGLSQVLVELAGGVARHREERLIPLPYPVQARKERAWQGLKARLSVLGPTGLELEPPMLELKVSTGQLAELIGSKPGAERHLVEKSPVFGSDGEEALDLLHGHGAAFLERRRVEPTKALERILCEIGALDAPIAEGGQGLGVVRQGLAGLPACRERAERLLGAWQAARKAGQVG